MPTSSAEAKPLPRRLSLLDLPSEILALIVRMCAEQDKAFKHRISLIGRAQEAEPKFLELLREQEERGYGKSVNCLFRTNRLLSKLSSEHVFHTLDATRSVDSSYRYFVASKHIARFRHVVLNRVDGEGLDVLVASLDRFERLNELTLDGYSARYAFGDHPVFDLDLARPATFRFAQIAPRIRKLHLSDFRPSAAAPYLKVLPFLEYFHYEIDDLWIPLEFASLLDSLPPIQHLHCEAPDAGGLRSFLAAVTTIPHDWTSLKRLTMTTPFIDLSMPRSLNLFEASLEELELVVEEDDPEGESEDLEDSDVPSWIDDGVRFPHLRSISIINSRGLLAKQFFRPVTKLHLPELRHLRVSHSADCGHGDDFTICTLSRLFEEHEHLKYLEFLAPDSLIAGDHREDIDRILERHEFTVTYRDCPEASYPADVFLDKSYPIWEPLIERYLRGGKQEEEEEALKGSLNRLREYFDKTLVNAEAIGDLPTLYRLAVLLRPLECERLAEFD